jgi:hypothetical protein
MTGNTSPIEAAGLRFIPSPAGVTVERDLNHWQTEILGTISWSFIARLLAMQPPAGSP